MKKILCILLCTLLCISALCGCTSNKTDTSDDPSDVSVEAPSVDISYDEVSYIIPGGNNSSSVGNDSSASSEEQPSESSTTEPSEIPSESSDEEPDLGEQQTGGFAVKMAKYDYNDEIEKFVQEIWGSNYMDVSIAILDITNETNQNYSITINGKYLDKNGTVLKTETQKWDQFEAGLQKYFLFKPWMKFERFEYDIEIEVYNGECWKNNFKVEYLGLSKCDRDLYPGTHAEPKWVESISAHITWKNDTPYKITFGYVYTILFDASGNVIGTFLTGNEVLGMESGKLYDGLHAQPLYFGDPEIDGKINEWPNWCKGVTGITVITSVEKKE